MKTVPLRISVLLVVGIIGLPILAQASDSVDAAQIISTNGNSFHLEVDRLKTIVEAGDIKDRQVIIVSIAGPYRTGKSFLLSFFLKYLYAKYKTNSTSTWLEGNINGYFKWRYGRDRTTTGIWMWPDIFTYDFDENNKVAIIIIDTQGIFDHETTTAESTKIFALTLMLSSIQCYNLMMNIQEDNLQHLEYFTEYGRNALGITGEKPFQKLLFIVRDWGFADETGYGLSHKIVDDVLAEEEDQTGELTSLRQNIKSSFQEIDSFLMPSPGEAVKRKNFGGDLDEVSSDFKKHVADLVSFIFDPPNLKVKTVNGVKIRAENLVEMLEKYVELFNGKTLPEPQSILQMQLELQYAVMLSNAVDLYTKTMSKHCTTEPCSEEEFLKLHQNAKNTSLSKFLAKKSPNNGGKESSIQLKLEHQIEEKFELFESNNKRNLEKFYMDLVKEGEQKYSNTMKGHLQIKSYPPDEFRKLLNNAKRTSIEQFQNGTGPRNGGRASTFELKLNNKIEEQRVNFEIQNDSKYNEFLRALEKQYTALVEESERSYIERIVGKLTKKSYEPNEFSGLHNTARQASMKQFQDRVGSRSERIASEYKLILSDRIDAKYLQFKSLNEAKYTNDSKYGRFCLTIEKAHTKGDCDPRTACDAYMKILFQGKKVFKTAEAVDEDDPVYNGSYCNNMHKDDRLTLEVWDADDFLHGDDDLMFTFNVWVGELLKTNTLSNPRGDFIIYMRNTWVPISSS